MPNTKSAKKRLRQSIEQRARNRATKSALRTHVKKVLAAAQEGNVEQAETAYREAASRLDRAGAKNVIHRNAASRQKARLQRVIRQAKSQAG